MSAKRNGLFVVIEGMDGAGKTSLIDGLMQVLTPELKAFNCRVMRLRDPGSTLFGEDFRGMIKSSKKKEPISPVAEFLGFTAVRRQMVDTVIEPLLTEGAVVICDRFAPSTVAYQGVAAGLIRRIGEPAFYSVLKTGSGHINPDIYIWLQISAEHTKERLKNSEDAFDKQPVEYFKKLETGYGEAFCKIAEDRGNTAQIDAMQPMDRVLHQALKNIRLTPGYQRITQ